MIRGKFAELQKVAGGCGVIKTICKLYVNLLQLPAIKK
jgi:hypothetical protein